MNKEVILEGQEMRDTEAVTRGADPLSTVAAEPPVGAPITTEKRTSKLFIKVVFINLSSLQKKP